MYKLVDGFRVEMAPEEVIGWEKEFSSYTPKDPTVEEHLAAIDAAILDLMRRGNKSV